MQVRSARGPASVSAARPPRPRSVAESARQPRAGPKGGQGLDADMIAEAALDRRANAEMRRELREQKRLYDPAKEKDWETRYKFFSGRHMKGQYRVFARARHDPLNKDPMWGKAVIKKVASACDEQSIDAVDLFRDADFEGSGTLNRPEVRKVLTSILPNISDMEVTAIFDDIDQDHSGEVHVQEFSDALNVARRAKVSEATGERWRNPVHRIPRYPPATIEGWSHLADVPSDARTGMDYNGFVQAEAQKVFDRVAPHLRASPRALQHETDEFRYDTFFGGGHGRRFRRAAWDAHEDDGRSLQGASRRADVIGGFAVEFDDPGPDVRPGFMCTPEDRKIKSAKGFAALAPKRSVYQAGRAPLTAR